MFLRGGTDQNSRDSSTGGALVYRSAAVIRIGVLQEAGVFAAVFERCC
jgi:hypothetical protein